MSDQIKISGSAGAKMAGLMANATPARVDELRANLAAAEAEVELLLGRKVEAEAKAKRARERYVKAAEARDSIALELAMTAKLAGVEISVDADETSQPDASVSASVPAESTARGSSEAALAANAAVPAGHANAAGDANGRGFVAGRLGAIPAS